MKKKAPDTSGSTACERSHWIAIALLFLSGSTVALHIGKVPAALPELRQFWQLSLTQASLIVSLYALMIAATGMIIGLLVKRYGYRNFAVLGIALVGTASIAGSLASGFSVLLLTRVIEGFGWIISAIAIPPLLNGLAATRDQPLVMGIWGAFVPLGSGCMLFLSPLLQSHGDWRLSWQFAGALSLIAALAVMLVARRFASKLEVLQSINPGPGFAEIRQPLIWIISGCFFIYSIQFTAVTSFLPSLFLETSDWTLPQISYLVALVVVSNAAGNIMAGVLLRRGYDPVHLLFTGAVGMGCSCLLIFNAELWLPLRLLAAFAFTIIGGLMPGTCFGSLPRVASCAAGVGLLIGLMMQCSGFGQLAGPVMLAASVDYSGTWMSAGYLFFGISLAGVVSSIKLRQYGI